MAFLKNSFVSSLLNRSVLHPGLHSFVIVVIRPLQFVRSMKSFITKAVSNTLQEQFLPSVEGVGFLQYCNCDTVYSPHDPSLLWQGGNCSLHLPSTKINDIELRKKDAFL